MFLKRIFSKLRSGKARTIFMRAKKEPQFCKRVSCPPGELLMAFHAEELDAPEQRDIAKHLQECEFCDSELRFLVAFPPGEEACQETEMPFPLRQLAEALLKRKYLNPDFLSELGDDKETLPLGKV
jgi:hypothetical protein